MEFSVASLLLALLLLAGDAKENPRSPRRILTVSMSKITIDSTLLPLTQAFSNALSGS